MTLTTHTLRTSSHTRIAVRVLGALVILFVGADHYWQYAVDDYSVVPTIGTLFLLNFISATGVGLLLLAPLERVSQRFGPTALKLVAFSGFGIAAASLAALLYSEQGPAVRLHGVQLPAGNHHRARHRVLRSLAARAAAVSRPQGRSAGTQGAPSRR
jgi:hypothetical protein